MSAPTVTRDEYELAQIELKRLSAHHARANDDAQRQSTERLMHQQEHIMREYETVAAVHDANLRRVGGGSAPRKALGVRSTVPKHSNDVVARGNTDYENDGAAGGGGGGDGGGYGDGLGGGGMGDQGAKRKRTVRSPLEVWTERAGAATQLILDHEARLAKYRASIAKLNTRIARLRADGVGMLADDPLLVQLADATQKQTNSEAWLIKQRVLLSTAEEKLRDVAGGRSTRRAVVSRVGAAPSGSGKTKKGSGGGGDLDAHSETDAAGGDEDNNPFVTEAQRLVRRCATMKKLEAIPKGDLKGLHRAIHALLVQCKKRLVRYHAQREWANRGFQREDKARIRADVDYMYGVAKQAKRGKTTQPDSHTLLADKVNTWLELQRERRVLARQQRHYKEGNGGANSEAISGSLRALDERWTVFHLAVITNNERTTQGLQVTLERAFYRVCCLRKGKRDVTRKADEARAEAVRAAGEHVLFLKVPTRVDKAGVNHWDALSGRGKETVAELQGKQLQEFTRIAQTQKKKTRGGGEGGGGGGEVEKSNSEDSGGGEGGTQSSRLELLKFLKSAPDTAYIFSNSEEEEEEEEEAVQRVVHQGAGRWGKQQTSSSSSSSSSDSDELVHSSGSKAGSASGGGGGGGSGSMSMGGGGRAASMAQHRAHRPEADAYRATGVSGVPLSNRWIAGYQTRLSSDPVKAKQFELNNARLTLEAVVGEPEGDSSAEGHRRRHEAQVRLDVVRAEYVAVMTEKWRRVRAADAAAADIDDVRARLHALKGRLDDATAAVTQSGIQCDGWVHRLHSVGGDATPYEQEQAALAQEDLRIMKARFQERLREWTFTFEAAKPDTDDEAEEDGSNDSDSLSESEDADSEAIGDASDAEESGSGNEEEEDEDEEETGQDPMAYDSGRSARTEAMFGSLLARTGMPFRAAASKKSSFEAKGKEALAEALQAERDAIAHDRRMTKRRQTRLSGGGRATDVQDNERLAKGASATLVWQPEKKTLCLQLWDRNDAFGWVSFANVKRTVRQQIRIGKGEYEADPQHPGSVSEKQLYDAREEENEDEEENDSVNNPGALFKRLADMRLHLGALYFHSTFQVDNARKGQSGPVLTINCGTRKPKSGEKVRIAVTEVLEIGFFPQNALLFAPWDPQDASAWLMRKHIAWQLSMHTLRKAAQSQSFMGKLMRYASAAAKRGYTRLLENTEDETMPALTKSTLFDFLRRGMLISNNDTACVALQSHRDPYSETHVPANPARRRRRGAAAPRKKTKKAPAASDDVMRTALQFYAARM